MAFPNPRLNSTFSFSTNTSFTVVIPSTPAVGELVSIRFAVDAGRTPITLDNALAQSFQQQVGQTDGTLGRYIYERVWDGTEVGLDFDFSIGATSDTVEGLVRVIEDFNGDIDNDTHFEVGTATSGAAPDCPSATAGWGSAENLFDAMFFADNNSTVSAWPTNYTLSQQEDASFNALNYASAMRQLEAATDDPSAYTISTARAHQAVTAIYRGTSPGVSVSITDAGDELYQVGDTVAVVGSNFGATQGSGRVVISPTDNINDAGAVVQTVTAWANTTVNITAVRGALAFATNLFLFVEEDSGSSNASGYVVQFEPLVQVNRTLVSPADGSALANDSGNSMAVWRNRPPTGAPDQELSGLSADGNGDLVVTIENTGLSDGDPIWVAVFDDDAVVANAQGTLTKMVPDYL